MFSAHVLLELGLDWFSYQLLAVAGAPYDTLEEVIGIRDSNELGSLKDFGVEYREVPVGFYSPFKTWSLIFYFVC